MRKLILLIENEEAGVPALHDLLAQSEQDEIFSVQTVSTEAAIGQIKSLNYDLLIVDYHSIFPNNLNLIEEHKISNASTPFIVINKGLDPDAKLRSFEADASYYIDKTNINPSFLNESIRACLEKKEFGNIFAEDSLKLKEIIRLNIEIATTELDAEELPDFIAEKIGHFVECDGVSVGKKEGQEFVYKGNYGRLVYPKGLRIRTGWGFSGQAIGNKRILFHGKLSSHSGKVGEDYSLNGRIGSGVAIPLFFADEPVGIINVFSERRDWFERGIERSLELLSVMLGSILHKKNVEHELRSGRNMLKSALKIANLGSWEWNVIENKITWSEEVYSIFGISKDEIRISVNGFFSFVHPDDEARVRKFGEELLEYGTVTEIDHRIVRPDGEIRSVVERAELIRSSKGEPTFIIGTVQDVTEKKRSEENLRLLQIAIEKSTDIFLITESEPIVDPGPKIVYVNEAFEKITGYTRGEVIGKTPKILRGSKSDLKIQSKIEESMSQWKQIREETLNYRKDGTEFWTELDMFPINDSTGRYTHWISIHRDVTERKQTEERLMQSQKMEAVGQLAGGLAHDFNNLLNVILANLDLLELKLKESPDLLKRVTSAQDAVQRGVEVNRRLLSFSRKQPINPEIADVNRLLCDFSPILEKIQTDKVGVELEISNESLICEIEKSGLENALLNLTINARDAMPDGGTIRISSGLLKNAASEGVRISGLEQADYCLVTVTDSGIGMDETVKARIFEPFFSTKGAGKGTGLGLSMVYGFVKQSKGFVKVISVPGHGTSFLIFLPILSPDHSVPADEGAILP